MYLTFETNGQLSDAWCVQLAWVWSKITVTVTFDKGVQQNEHPYNMQETCWLSHFVQRTIKKSEDKWTKVHH